MGTPQTKYGNQVGHWRATIDWVTDTNASYVNVTAAANWQSVSWGFNVSTASGELGYKFNDTGEVGTLTGSFAARSATGQTNTIAVARATDWKFYRKQYDYTVTLHSSVTLGAYEAGTSRVEATVSVPALEHHTVSYNANGGSGAPAAQTKWYGTILTLSGTKPTRSGYSFAGWATSSGGKAAYWPGGQYGEDADVTLYAVWTQNAWTVSYSANGGSGAPASQTKRYGTNLTLSSTKPTRTGYAFKNWNTAANGGGTAYSPGGTYSANAGATLYAQWTANTYTITYSANVGSGGPGSQRQTYGTSVTIPSTKPTRANYSFLGWCTNASGSGTWHYAGQGYQPNANVTLYAIWRKSYATPSISCSTPQRCDSSGGYDDSGTYARTSVSWSVDKSWSDNTGATIQAWWRAVGQSGDWTAGTAASLTGTSGTYALTLGAGGLSTGSAYDIRVRVTDKTSNSPNYTDRYTTVGSTYLPLDLMAKGRGVGLGHEAVANRVALGLPLDLSAASGYVGGSWLASKDGRNALITLPNNQANGSSYVSVMGGICDQAGNSWSFGTVGSGVVGLYGYKAGRTANGTDTYATFSPSTGALAVSGIVTASGVTSGWNVVAGSSATYGVSIGGSAQGAWVDFRESSSAKMRRNVYFDAATNTLSTTGRTIVNGQLVVNDSEDLAGGTANSGGLIVGVVDGAHMAVDANEIQAKSSGTATGNLCLNSDGGGVYINNSYVAGWVTQQGSVTGNDKTVWYYHRFSNGAIHAYCMTAAQSIACNKTYGSVYYCDISNWSAPSGVPGSTVVSVNVTPYVDVGLYGTNVYNVSGRNFSFRLISANSQTRSMRFMVDMWMNS